MRLQWIGDALCEVAAYQGVPLVVEPDMTGVRHRSDSVIAGEYPDGPLPVAHEPVTGAR